MKNITKLTIGVAIFAVLMVLPISRSIILFLLPLGSGIDDLLFFVALFALAALAILRCATVNPIRAFAEWLLK